MNPSSRIDLLQPGVAFGVSGWGKLSPPGDYRGIIPLKRAYLLERDSRSMTVVDAITGWAGTLTSPIRVYEPIFDES